jgi:hypothetical protein
MFAKKQSNFSNKNSANIKQYEKAMTTEKELFREGEDQGINQKVVQFTHWNSGNVYSGVVESNFLLLGERHCRVFVSGQKKPFTVKYDELIFRQVTN